MHTYRLSRVAVVGGGPAGSFFALHFLQLARAAGFSPEVHVYEPRDFSQGGPKGCNRCAGILSSSAIDNLRDLGLEVPPEVVQSRISVYSLHSPFGAMDVAAPSPGQEIFSVYRGAGPLRHPLPASASFDGFLLGQAAKAGAEVRPFRVQAVRLLPRPAVRVEEVWEEYDLVVLATGINASSVPVEGLLYRPPATHRMAQDELYARPGDIQEAFGSRVKVFLLPYSDLIFGSLVPKGSFINVSLLGQTEAPSLEDFLSHPLVKTALPFAYERACGCRPAISVGVAQEPVADGFVAVGDAGVTRLYKDGIGAALLTARQAARTVVNHGATAEALRRHYLPFLKALHRDNGYGRFLFTLHRRLRDSPAFFRAQARLVAEEKERPGPRPYHKALWGMFTGSYSYGEILRTTLKPAFPARLALEAARQRVKGPTLGPSRILVLGGGFGGVYTTLALEKALRKQKQVDITLVSRENFFLFTPLLHEVATGGIETRHIAFPIRSLRGKRRFNFMQAEVRAIDLDKKAVHTNRGALDYDFLVLALGSTTDTRDLPLECPHVFTLKDLYDGRVLRNHIISLFEEADVRSPGHEELLTIVVVGGGATGVQLIAEMRDFIVRSVLANYVRVKPSQVRLILLQDEDRLLTDMHPSLAEYALSVLRRKGVEVRLGCRVARVLAEGVEVDGGEVLPARALVWTAGIRCNPVICGLPADKDGLGRLKVDQHMELPGYDGVYALGDAALVIDPRTGRPLPARAHVAVRQPGGVARNIVASLSGGRKRPCPIPWMAETVSLGSQEAAIRLWKVRLFGFVGRFLWLSSYALLVPSLYIRTRVMLDWMLARVFGRDTTLLRRSRD